MRYGAAVVIMAFDEQGQAADVESKIRICSRAFKKIEYQKNIFMKISQNFLKKHMFIFVFLFSGAFKILTEQVGFPPQVCREWQWL